GSAPAQARSLAAFTRLHERLIPGTELEIDLPGSADALFAYRVSAVSASQVESARSASITLVAVPHRVVPGRPQLRTRTVDGGVEVLVLPGPGPAPADWRVHRVRRAGLAVGVGTMGPPVL